MRAALALLAAGPAGLAGALQLRDPAAGAPAAGALAAPAAARPARVLVAVNSQVGHVEARALARRSWIPALERSGPAAGFEPRVVFVLSDPNRSAPLDAVGPVHVVSLPEPGCVVLPVPEGYATLAQKTAALLRWAATEPDDVLVGLDDDVYVHADRLWPRLRELRGSGYAGYTQLMPTPQNADPASKWFVNETARKALPDNVPYVTGQFKVLTKGAVSAAVAAMAKVPVAPFGVGNPAHWIEVEDEYLGVLMHAAGVSPTTWQKAVAPQCCGSDDVFIALDGDTYFVKTAGGQQKWDDSRTTAASLCRYRIAASRGSSSAPFCLTADELSLARCPPSRPTGHEAETDRLLPTICAR